MSTTPLRRRRDGSASRLAAFGVAAFAGIMLATVAIFQILQGIAAIGEDDVYVSGPAYTYELDVSTWGWIHLAIGVVGLATGIGILVGQTWARVVGIALAALSALANFAFLPYYPLWALVVLAFDALVIWALCTHGTDRR